MKGYLRIVIPPAQEFVTSDEIKEYSRWGDDASLDNTITALIRAARMRAEKFQNRSYLMQTCELSFDGLPNTPIELPRPPLSEVLSVKLYALDDTEINMDLASFNIDTDSEPGRITLKYGQLWPLAMLRDINSVKIQYKAGYSGVAFIDENVKLAIKLLVTCWLDDPKVEPPAAFYNLLWQDRVVPV